MCSFRSTKKAQKSRNKQDSISIFGVFSTNGQQVWVKTDLLSSIREKSKYLAPRQQGSTQFHIHVKASNPS